MRASYQRALGIFVLALVLLLIPSTTNFVGAQAQKGSPSPGACFIYPQGTTWSIFSYPGDYQYHNGCEKGGSCGAIMGYDYIAPRGTPIFAPFDGTVTYASQSIGGSDTICSGKDTVGNSVFKMVDDATGVEFGMLHSACDGGFLPGDHVDAGQQIATVQDVGNTPTHPVNPPHPHVWFRDPATGQNIPDQTRFWQCKVRVSPGNLANFNPDDSVEILGQQSIEELNTFIDLLTQLFSAPSLPSQSNTDEVEKYDFYISQQSQNQNYQYNFIAFFAGHGMANNPGAVEKEAMKTSFEGYWEIPKGGQVSMNDEFAWGLYTELQGMKLAPGANGEDYGNGVCNAGSALHYVLAESGLSVDVDDNTHPPVAGVPEKYLTTIYAPGKDLKASNEFDHPVRLHWSREGDKITLWVEHQTGLKATIANTQEDLQQWQALYELAMFFAEFDWARLGAIFLALITFIILIWLWTKVFGLRFRTLVMFVGISLLVYAWVLPKNETWLETPVNGGEITQYYGDPRRDLAGYTGLTYVVPDTTSVVSVASGRVISPNNASFKENQVWLEVGNGLYLQYAQLTTIHAQPGDWLGKGGKIGEVASGAEFRLGVSSKHPDVFYEGDERGFGWLNPEEYLGQIQISSKRREESAGVVLGWALVFLALFWPKRVTRKLVKILGTDLPYPWDGKRLFRNSLWFVLSIGLFLLGKWLVSPFLLELTKPIIIITGLYLLWREIFRGKVVQRKNRDPGIVHILLYVAVTIFWVTRTVMFVGAAIANPDITFAARGGWTIEDLPQVVVPGLTLPDELPPWLLNQADSGQDEELAISQIPGWDQQWLAGSALPEFTTTYWTGSPVRFYAPPDLWAAIMRQAPKHPNCDPRLAIITAQSESSGYVNHVSENSAYAAGIWQFIRTTWEWMMPGVPMEGRNDLDLAADAALKYLDIAGVCDATTEEELVDAFARNAPVWNMHVPQAEFVWRTYVQLRELMGE